MNYQERLDQARKAREEAIKQGVIEAKIVKVEEGIVRDFVGEEYLDEFKDPDRGVIQVTIETPEGSTTTKILSMSISKNSEIQKYKAKYGKYPEVGGVYPIAFRETAKGEYWKPEKL